MSNVSLFINGIAVEVPAGTTILRAAEKVGIKIPTLCWHPDLTPWAACGICIVKSENSPKMLRACSTPVENNMKIITHDAQIIAVRKTVIQLILSTHPDDCLKCPRNQQCELQRLAAEFGVRETPYPKQLNGLEEDTSSTSIILHPERCVKCGRCVQVCQDMQGVHAIEFLGRGEHTRIAPAADVKLGDSPCIRCGQCSAHCPVGAIYERSQCTEVWNALQNPELHTVVQIAPAVRVAIGEAFGYEPGTLQTGKLYAALRRLGFKAVFDTNFSADLTIMEEGTEFITKFTKDPGSLPLITSCCPAWVDYMEKFFPDLIPHFSTAKSPQQMLGAVAKTYYADKIGVTKKNMYVVSVMPCTAKKYEVDRNADMRSTGDMDVDVAITTRELANMIKSAGIDFKSLPDETADSILGTYTGAGTIFGVTGGVMEAALRTAHAVITGKEMTDINVLETRGLEGVKEGAIKIGDATVNIAVAHGTANVSAVLEKIREAKKNGTAQPWQFIEVMACRGGCIGGGGQPYGANDEVRKKRTLGIYSDDEKSTLRCSHQNPEITAIYKEFLGEPCGHKSHELLHTHYTARPLYNK